MSTTYGSDDDAEKGKSECVDASFEETTETNCTERIESESNTTRTPWSRGGGSIAAILQSHGPIVKAVLLRHMRKDGKDTKPHPHVVDAQSRKRVHADENDSKPAANDSQDRQQLPLGHTENENHSSPQRSCCVLLEELIDEIDVDTTPSRNHVSEVLGGPVSFLGQWQSEGTVAVIRKDCLYELPGDLRRLPIKALRNHCQQLEIDTGSMIEKSELIEALEERQNRELPLNPHKLQPPLNNLSPRGDILVMKVAEEECDDRGGGEEQSEFESMSNDDFFLNYTKEEYLRFASRTDIIDHRPDMLEQGEESEEVEDDGPEDDEIEDSEEEEDDEDNHDDDEDDINDEDYQFDASEELDKHALLNVILGGAIQNFRHDHGRGPNAQELLELRSVVAAELDVEVPPIPQEENGDRREGQETNAADARPFKRVKFASERGMKQGPTEGEDPSSKITDPDPGDRPHCRGNGES